MMLGEVGGSLWCAGTVVVPETEAVDRARERPQPEQGWGLQIYPLSYFKLLTEY